MVVFNKPHANCYVKYANGEWGWGGGGWEGGDDGGGMVEWRV